MFGINGRQRTGAPPCGAPEKKQSPPPLPHDRAAGGHGWNPVTHEIEVREVLEYPTAERVIFRESRWGTTTRFSLGLRYIINTQVHLLAGVGYAEQDMTLDDGSITISALPLALGLRGGF